MKKAILVVCHDAGAAEVVSSWVIRQIKQRFIFCVQGPAEKVFQRKLKQFVNLSLEAAFDCYGDIHRVVTGTSWSTNLERVALKWAKQNKIPTTTFLDHWINYRIRFVENGELILPDEILVYDEIGKLRAEQELGHKNVKIIENPHWEDVLLEMQSLVSTEKSDSGTRILYCTQPIEAVAQRVTGSPLGYGYTEFSALDAFVEHIRPQFSSIAEFRLRVHPSESSDKYTRYLREKNLPIPVTVSRNEDLVTDMAWAHWVVGCDTMAMVLGLKAHRRVLCSIPKGGKPLDIPLEGIERLFR